MRHEAFALALEGVSAWPATNAASAVVVATETVATYGSSTRTFPLASVTKLLTAAAVLVAVEEGIVDLDEPAGPPGASVRHLLAHASGLAARENRPVAPPGTKRIYSNIGYDLLGKLVAARAAMPFAEYLGEAILEPLGMADTQLAGSPAHGAAGTLDDLAVFARELLAPRFVAGETLAEATAVAFPGLSGVLPGFGRQKPCDWGLGFELRDWKSPHWTGQRNSPRTFGHFGRAGTFLWVDPDAGVALACLTDCEFGPWAKRAWPALSDAVLAAVSSL